MRQFYVVLRVYRKRDQRYWTLYVQISAENLTALDQTIGAYVEGLKVAGADPVTLENIGFDTPSVTGDFHRLDDPFNFAVMYKFLQTRDRRVKQESYTTEDTPSGTDNS